MQDHYDWMTDQDRWFFEINATGDLDPRFTLADARRVIDAEAPATPEDVRGRLAKNLYWQAREECDELSRTWLRMHLGSARRLP